jgi:DNA polymerase-3 subunit epsilon
VGRRFVLQLAGLCALLIGLFAVVGLPLWLNLSLAEREQLLALLAGRGAMLAGLGLVLLALLGGLLWQWRAAYPAAARRLEEEVGIVHRVNPKHRLAIGGAKPMRRLGHALNAFATAYDAQREDIEARITQTNARLEQEKNRLAALMSELAESVLVCNLEGRILLYNAQASQMLDGREAGAVGLGRSLFGILDQRLIEHGLDKLRAGLEQGGAGPAVHFVSARAEQLLRCRMAPVLGHPGELLGFVLILEDVTDSVELASRREHLLRQLTEGSRAALANIRAAAETLQQYPNMDAGHRQRFGEVIRDEAERLSLNLEQGLARHGDLPGSQWPLEEMLASELVCALQRNFTSTLGLNVRCQDSTEPLWLSLDSYSLVQALTQVMDALAVACGVREVTLKLSAAGRFARLALCWGGKPLDPELLHRWEQQPLNLGGADPAACTLKELLERHGGELWSQADRISGRNRLCLLLPTTQPHIASQPSALGRPVYYDFDLFSQAGQTPELDECSLRELAYTVFDTETTGLSPSEGDEIIALGAVRIVNGRLLVQERFEQLVDPCRAIPRESQLIHGLTPQMLAGQPTIEQVLPVFQRFAEDTVLVAHNAAFDMRFLQLKEQQTGVRFIHPVLDTLLLSALVHSGHAGDEHRLEQIAARLGVQVVGRHTALGDAIVTGEVFLKLIPLLAERGIHTLKQAREASQQTLYAKLEY